jgi:hypothetical protein
MCRRVWGMQVRRAVAMSVMGAMATLVVFVFRRRSGRRVARIVGALRPLSRTVGVAADEHGHDGALTGFRHSGALAVRVSAPSTRSGRNSVRGRPGHPDDLRPPDDVRPHTQSDDGGHDVRRDLHGRDVGGADGVEVPVQGRRRCADSIIVALHVAASARLSRREADAEREPFARLHRGTAIASLRMVTRQSSESYVRGRGSGSRCGEAGSTAGSRPLLSTLGLPESTVATDSARGQSSRGAPLRGVTVRGGLAWWSLLPLPDSGVVRTDEIVEAPARVIVG